MNLNDSEELFENILRKGKNADDKYFLSFIQCFLPFQKKQEGHDDSGVAHLSFPDFVA